MGYEATGDLADTATAAMKVAADPYLPEVTCHVLRLSALEEGKKPGPPCLRTRAGIRGGAGLRYAVVPMRILVGVYERPYRSAAVAGGILLGIFALGYFTGKGRR